GPMRVSSLRALIPTLVDSLYGFDYFISYSWRGSGEYSRQLAEGLRKHRMECFLDRSPEGLAPGGELNEETAPAVRRSTALLGVVDQNALCSPHVQHEVELFDASGRLIIPIELNGTLMSAREDSAASHLAGSDVSRSLIDTLLEKIPVVERFAAPKE